MIGKKINQLATELAPVSTDLTIIGDPISGVSKKITLAQLGAIFSGAVSFYTNLAGFPATGDINVIYCAKDTQKLYLWSGSAYVEVFPSQALLDTYQLRSEKGVSNGYASLDSSGKVPISQLPSSIMEYKGTWNAATNTPTLANGTGDTGDVYICNVAGTVNFGAGPITFAVGDYVIYSGSIWQRSSGAVGTVTSVAVSRSGDALAITGSPITTSGTINIGFAGTGAQYIKGDGTLATFPSTIAQAERLITEVYNSTGATLTKGTIVYINGGQGNLPTVTKALATGDSTSAQTFGVVQADITNNNNGYVVVAGKLSDLDTQAYTEGTQLYLSSTTAGTWTSTKQYAPAHLVYVGIVVRSHPTQGIVEIKIQNGYELDELHNVAAQTPTNNDGLFWESATSLWKNKSIATILGGTPVTGSGTLYALTKWGFTSGTIINSNLYDTGSVIYNNNATAGAFAVQFNGNATSGMSYGLLINAGSDANDIALRIQNVSSTSEYFFVYGDGKVKMNNIPNATTDTDTFLVSDGGFIKYRTGSQLLSDIGGQAALTNPVTGTGTTNTLPKFTGASTIGNSNVTDSGSLITLGSNTNISGGSLGIGSISLTGYNLRVSKAITGLSTSYGIAVDSLISTDVTVGAVMYRSVPTTAASLTLTNLWHYLASSVTIGSGSSVTNQFGFVAGTGLTTATNNYGFYGDIASGTGRWNIYMNGTAANYMAGALGIGTTTLSNVNLYIAKNITGGTSAFGVVSDGTVQSDVTANAFYYRTDSRTAAASFLLSNLVHYQATQATFGAGSSVGTQSGFRVTSNVIGATNNYAFWGQIPSGANRWNLYMDGTAANYLNGDTSIGTTTGGFKLNVGGTLNVTGAATFSSSVTAGGKIFTSASVADNIIEVINSDTTNGYGLYVRGGGTASNRYVARFKNGADSDVMWVGTSNVGIGTTSPSYTLDVSGTGRFYRNDSGNISLTLTNAYINQGNLINFVHNSGGSTTNGYIGHGGDSTGNFVIINNSITALSLARSTGAATFSSSVTASFLTTKSSSGAAALLMQDGSGVNKWEIGHQSNNLYFYSYTAGSSPLYILGNGNVGIGTTSPSTKLHIVDTNPLVVGDSSGSLTVTYETGTTAVGQGGGMFLGIPASSGSFFSTYIKAARESSDSSNSAASLVFGTRTNGGSNTERMRITSGGLVGIGTSSPDVALHIYKTPSSNDAAVYNLVLQDPSAVASRIGSGISFGGFYDATNTTLTFANIKGFKENTTSGDYAGALAFTTRVNGGNPTERMRITSGGKLVIGSTSTTYGTLLGVETSNSASPVAHFKNNRNTSGDAAFYLELGANARNTSSYYLQCFDSGQDQLYIYGNGNVVNRNNSYGAISDIRLKENISDTTSKLADLLKVKVRNYNLIGDDKKQLGVIAQELETIFPSMIEIDGKTGMKQVKYSVFVPMLIKAIQELNDKIK